MYIVVDTNIWISELGLSTPRGLALQFFAKQRGSVFAIPEVVKREVEVNIKRLLVDHRDNIENSYEQLLSIFGEMKEIVLPNENDIDGCVADLFNKVTVETKHIPFSLLSAKHSFEMVIHGVPPSGPKNQQFKDGVIWADCLSLLSEGDVALLTKDKGFYQDRNYQSGLAKNLLADTEGLDNNLQIYSTLTELLQEIEEAINIDRDNLVKEFLGEVEEFSNRLLNQNGFEISGEPDVNLSSYVTEDVSKLYIEFEIQFPCSDTTEEERGDATLTLEGDAMYEPESNRISEMRRKGEALDFVDSEGNQQRKNIVVMVGTAVIGHRTVEKETRHKINN